MVADQDDAGAEDRVFKTMAQRCSYLEPLRVTRKTLTTLRRFDLPVGHDGRCRYSPRPWASSTGRNQPKTREGNIYGLPKWARRLIKPEPGRALAYVDLRACEYGIQAALSRDPRMMESYKSEADVYLRLAELAGAVPAGATKATHPRERMLYKVAQLAASYGQSPYGLSKNTGCTLAEAKRVHANMERVYSRYYSWRERTSLAAECARRMTTPLGWSVPIDAKTKQNFLLNFPIQGAGADILRAATTLMHDEGIRILAMVHDAVLIEDEIQNIERSAKIVQDCWRKASKSILGGFELDSDIEIVRYPDTFAPEDTDEFWNFLTELRQEICVPRNDFLPEKDALEGSAEVTVSACVLPGTAGQ
jgi:DNA polymerase-1